MYFTIVFEGEGRGSSGLFYDSVHARRVKILGTFGCAWWLVRGLLTRLSSGALERGAGIVEVDREFQGGDGAVASLTSA